MARLLYHSGYSTVLDYRHSRGQGHGKSLQCEGWGIGEASVKGEGFEQRLERGGGGAVLT
jgi:hypothetical protein